MDEHNSKDYIVKERKRTIGYCVPIEVAQRNRKITRLEELPPFRPKLQGESDEEYIKALWEDAMKLSEINIKDT